MRFVVSNLLAFLRDRRAAASLEYVLLLLPLLAMVFTSFQIALAYHFALTAQKAVEQGARIAVVRDAVHLGLPETNPANTWATTGDECALQEQGDPGPKCASPGGPWRCSGQDLTNPDCDAVRFKEIFDEVARIAYLLDPDDMSITYSYAALGFANGPFTPIVEVAIEERPFFLQFFFNLAVGNPNNELDELQLPAVAASAIAEDLSSTN